MDFFGHHGYLKHNSFTESITEQLSILELFNPLSANSHKIANNSSNCLKLFLQKAQYSGFKCGALRDLISFVQFKKREKHPWRTVNFSKLAGCKINTPPWVFFTFLKSDKWYQIAQRITNKNLYSPVCS